MSLPETFILTLATMVRKRDKTKKDERQKRDKEEKFYFIF